MLLVKPGEPVRVAVASGLWVLAPDEAFFGPAKFELRPSGQQRDAFELQDLPGARACKVAAKAAGAVALLTAQQVTTRGRLLRHAWAIGSAHDAPGTGATP